jgi:hypothetical protein
LVKVVKILGIIAYLSSEVYLEMSNIFSLNLSNQLLETPPSNSYHAKNLQQKTNQKNQPKIRRYFFRM